MMTEEHLTSIISALWLKGLPFAAWRLPGRQEVRLIVQLTETVQLIDLKNIETVKGFVMAPFERAHTGKAYIIRPDLSSDSLQELKVIEQLPAFRKNEISGKTPPKIWDEEAYLEKARGLISILKNNRLKKIVLSRIVEKKFQKDVEPGLMFTRLNQQYTDSFNYICYLPEEGSWIGASPELFLKVDHISAQTVSLAGTKPAGKRKWEPKEIEEQAIVTDFVTEKLEDLGIKNYRREGPITARAGNVEHLFTRFRIPLTELKKKTGKLISCLHPTPAVCGMPQQEAFDCIVQTEDHQRKCYTGFLGPWQLQGSSELYVNLRCAEFDRKTLRIFVGGGLTASSVAEAEWEETELKSQTLLSVMENL